MNPRLPLEWLRYLVTIGARRDPDGWRWKLDPAIRFGGFGPWRPDWALQRLKTLEIPLMGFVATAQEEMGWGTDAEAIRRHAPAGCDIITFPDTGHFIHIERPHDVAEPVLEFLA